MSTRPSIGFRGCVITGRAILIKFSSGFHYGKRAEAYKENSGETGPLRGMRRNDHERRMETDR
jgi:hypothetical protein